MLRPRRPGARSAADCRCDDTLACRGQKVIQAAQASQISEAVYKNV